jgi:hypothetical protein
VTVTDVAPAISIALGIDTLFETETFSRSGSFTDPGTNSWTAAVNWQDGTGDHPLTLTAKTFALSHQYGAGAHSVSGKISDGHVTSGGTAHPVVLNRGGAVDYIRVQASVALSTLTLPGGFAAQVDQKPQAVHHQIRPERLGPGGSVPGPVQGVHLYRQHQLRARCSVGHPAQWVCHEAPEHDAGLIARKPHEGASHRPDDGGTRCVWGFCNGQVKPGGTL